MDGGQNSTDLDIAIGVQVPKIKHTVSNKSSFSDDEVIKYIEEGGKSPSRTSSSIRNRPRSIKSRKGSMRGSFRVPRPESDTVRDLVIDKNVETNMVST